jgi:hypothetical protein
MMASHESHKSVIREEEIINNECSIEKNGRVQPTSFEIQAQEISRRLKQNYKFMYNSAAQQQYLMKL